MLAAEVLGRDNVIHANDVRPGPVELADAILKTSRFDAKKDILLVIFLSGTKGFAVRGNYTDKDVVTLLKEFR